MLPMRIAGAEILDAVRIFAGAALLASSNTILVGNPGSYLLNERGFFAFLGYGRADG